MYKRKILLLLSGICFSVLGNTQTWVAEQPGPNLLELFPANNNPVICTGAEDFTVIQKTASFLRDDIERTTGKKPALSNELPASSQMIIIIGSLEKSVWIQQLAREGKIDISRIKTKWEACLIQQVTNPFKGIAHALIIAGSDRRGAAYGVMELSRQMG